MSKNNRKAIIKNVDMSEIMQQDMINLANYALNLHTIEQDIAKVIKQECDKKYQSTWHCIVGRNFGSYVTYESSCHIYFHMDNVAILIFKSV